MQTNQQFKRDDGHGEVEYFDGKYWLGERDVCHHCEEQREAEGKPYREACQQFSLGIYAGRYCEPCWEQSGYRKDGAEGFDPADAGEAYWEDDY